MRANALLVRSRFGWSYELAGTPTDVVEGLLELGNQPSPEAVTTLAQAQLDRYATDLTQITVAIEPALALDGTPDLNDTPGHAYVEGDTVTVDGDTERVVSFTVERDRSTGQRSYSVELRSRLLEEEQRINQTLQKMVDGTMRGDSAVASPVRPEPTRPERAPRPGSVPVIFDRDASVTAHESKPWTFDRSGFITQVQADVPGGEDCWIVVRIDGVNVHGFVMEVGATSEQNNGLAIPYTKGQVMTVYSPDIGFDIVVSVQVT